MTPQVGHHQRTRRAPVCEEVEACDKTEGGEAVDDGDEDDETNGSPSVGGTDNYFCDTPRTLFALSFLQSNSSRWMVE